jgi:hypothetical protein
MTVPATLSPSPSPKAGSSWGRGEIALLIGPFVVVWGAYLALRASMPDDALAPFRSGLYWPDGAPLMMAKGGGIVSRVLLHMGFTFGLGLLLLIVFVVVRSAVSKRETQSRLGVFVCFALAFLVMLGVSTVPNRLTRIDEGRGALVVSHMIPVPPWTMSTEELELEEVRALGARLGVRGTKSKERVVRLFALPVTGEPLELGEAECPGTDAECLEWADPAAAALAKALGWKGKLRASMADDGKLRRYESSVARE